MNGSQLKNFRDKLGLSQEDVADKSHLAQNAISQYENDKRGISEPIESVLLNSLNVVPMKEYIQLLPHHFLSILDALINEDCSFHWVESAKMIETNKEVDKTKYPISPKYGKDYFDNSFYSIFEGGALLIIDKKGEQHELTFQQIFNGITLYLNSEDYQYCTDTNFPKLDEEEGIGHITANEILYYAVYGKGMND